MRSERLKRQFAHNLEGRTVSIALADGSRIDDATLVSVGRAAARTLWLFSNGADVFVAHGDVIDLWASDDHYRAA
jgi:hypothetical protein